VRPRPLWFAPLWFLLLGVFALLVFLPGQRRLPPIDRDEPRYAQATEQMLASGDFIDVRFQEVPRDAQPAGIYWLQALAETLAGTPGRREIWVHRLPSLIAAVAAVLLTARLGAALFDARAGLLAGGLLAASLLLGFEARLATTDATLLALVMVAQSLLWEVFRRRGADPPPLRVVLGFWIALGCGLMVKGPVILLITGSTLAALAAAERRARWMVRLRPGFGLLVVLAIVLPWCVAIGIASHGAFFAHALGVNFFGKVASGQQAHGAPPGVYLLLFPLMFWPGSIFAIRALPFVWRERSQPELRFLLCWIVPSWLVFELVATKLPHYVLPTYPAIACLAAAGCLTPLAALRPWQRRAFAGFAGIWLLLGLVLAFGPSLLLWRLEGESTATGFGAGILATVLLLAALWLLRAGRAARAALPAVLASALVFGVGYCDVLPALRTIWLSPRIAAALAAVRPCRDSVLATSGFAEPSLVFLAGGDLRLAGPSAAAALLSRDPACGLALVEARQAPQFLRLAAAAGVMPRGLAEIRGLNYSNGRRLDLTIYAAGRAGAAGPAGPERSVRLP
jgi:4-amino-4-deoxy-L-arabinose transferase-like glycosyltransferase